MHHNCNGPGFDPTIRRHSGIWGAADEAVLNIVRKKNPTKKYIKKDFFFLLAGQPVRSRWTRSISWRATRRTRTGRRRTGSPSSSTSSEPPGNFVFSFFMLTAKCLSCKVHCLVFTFKYRKLQIKPFSVPVSPRRERERETGPPFFAISC